MKINKIHTYKNCNIPIKNYNQNKTPLYSTTPFAQNLTNSPTGIQFSSQNLLTTQEKSFIKPNEFNISNILDLNKDIHIPRSKMPKGSEKYNSAGINIVIDENTTHKIYKITNDKGDVIALAKFDKNTKDLPQVAYRQGKFMPELTIKDTSLENKSIKMFAGSEIKGKYFEIKMFGQYEPTPNMGYKQISFSGNNVFLTKYKEKSTIDSVKSYYSGDFADEVIRGDYCSFVEKNEPQTICIATAKDDRLSNITGAKNNKYSIKLPTNSDFRSLGLTLNLLAMAGLLKGDSKEDKISFISCKSDKKNESKISDEVAAIANGILNNKIDINKDAIIIPADIVTNTDLSRAYQAFKNLPSAAVAIPYYLLDSQKAQGANLLAVKEDESQNKQIVDIVTNAQYTFEAPDPNDYLSIDDYDNAMLQYDKAQSAIIENDEQKFMANSGIYFFSKEAMKVLMAHGLIEDDNIKNLDDIVLKVLQLADKGKLKDENGEPFKIYAIPLEQKGGKEAVVDDINTAESYLKLIKDITAQYELYDCAKENKYYGIPNFIMKNFSLNTNLNTGVIYDCYESKMAFDVFKRKYELNQYCGNIYIAGE